MNLSKGLTRLGSAVAAAALLLSAGFAFASTTAHAQAPMLLYGPAPAGNSVVQVWVDGSFCETASVGAEGSSSTGFLWVAQIDDGECGASSGAAIAFMLDGASTNESMTWSPGGAPPNTAVGITLTAAGGGGGTTTPTPPDTGDAGLLAASSSSPWLALGLGIFAVAMLAGARSATGRVR
jgi:hypothetical protein